MNFTTQRTLKLAAYLFTLALFNCSEGNKKTGDEPVSYPISSTIPKRVTSEFVDQLYAQETVPHIIRLLPATVNPQDSTVRDLFLTTQLITENKKSEAVTVLSKLISKKTDSRTKLYAWNTLRELGTLPTVPEVLGLVLEVPVATDSIDILAMYLDKTARYVNNSMRGIIWEEHEPEIDKMIETVVNYGTDYSLNLYKNGKLRSGRPFTKPKQLRLTFLTTSGVFYVEKTWRDTDDKRTPFGYIFAVSTRIAERLIAKCAENLGVKTKQ